LGWVSLAAVPAFNAGGFSPADGEPRIARRTLAFGRDDSGRYRAVEVLEIDLGRTAEQPFEFGEPLALLRLPEGVLGFLSMGGDIAASRLIYEPPVLALSPGPGASTFRVAFTYMLPPGTERLEMVALLPVTELLLEVDRATVDARPGRGLAAEAQGGAAVGRQARFSANDLAPGSAATLELGSRRTGWRERLAVLFVVGGAAAAAGVWLWRAGRTADVPARA
jgi:hypothetical protein